jgi:hypothetical protein
MNWLRIRTVRNGDKRSGSDVRELLVKLVLTEVIWFNIDTFIQKNVLHSVLFKSSSRGYQTPLLVPVQCVVRGLQAAMLPEIFPGVLPEIIPLSVWTHRNVTFRLNLLRGHSPTAHTYDLIGEGEQIEKHQ